MLKPVTGTSVEIDIKNASYPSPFKSGLEYAAPARGAWNIVHTGMLVPQAHEIFVCAAGCLRGVVLTAAEMNASDRFSTITVRENNLLDGDMEQLIIEGVSDILTRLENTPPAVLVYTSCVHHFVGCDLKLVYDTLRKKYPHIDFIDCYMNPVMRKSGLTPDQLMRRQMYRLLKESPKDDRQINIIGNNLATDKNSELFKILAQNNYHITEIMDCNSYEQFLNMSKAFLNITYNSVAIPAGNSLETRLSQKHMYLPLSYNYKQIEQCLDSLFEYLSIEKVDCTNYIEKCEQALAVAKQVIGDSPIAIDYTATPRPFDLALLLKEHNFNVTKIYCDSISADDKQAFEQLKAYNIKLCPTVDARMRFVPRQSEQKLLAIGQKAAYFTGSNNFVNIVEGGGFYGFEGICQMAERMCDAFENEKDAKSLIQIKGLGCGCCI